ncbi:MAG: cation:proton antiporter [Myxococcales bacterium]|nr:cation:proton antiporter [Myxococcales bacterium]
MELNLLNVLSVVLAAYAGGLLARKAGYPMVLGEILAGIVLGPPLLGLLAPDEGVLLLGQLGILFMMLYIGMELEPEELRKASWGGLLAAVGGFIVPMTLCTGLMLLVGFGWLPALFVGVAAGVTSLATKSRILAELDLFHTRIAHVMMAGALVADTVSLVIFAALLGFASAGELDALSIAGIAGKALAFFAFAWVVGRFILPFVVRRTSLYQRLDAGGRFIAAAAFGLVMAEAAHLAGMHGILGAFVAGLMLNSDMLGREEAKALEKRINNLSLGFLAPFFFVTAGFAVDLSVLASHTGLVLAVIALGTLGKIFGTAAFYSATGHGWREGVAIGAGMNGRGAVEIIVAQIGLAMGVIDATVFSILVFMALATTATVPVLLGWATKWLRSRGELVDVRAPQPLAAVAHTQST